MRLPLSSLPAVNASLNGACTVFLLAGYFFIGGGRCVAQGLHGRAHLFARRFFSLRIFTSTRMRELFASAVKAGFGPFYFTLLTYAHDSRGGNRAARADHADAGGACSVRPPSCDRPVDLAFVALRFDHRRNRLLASLRCVHANRRPRPRRLAKRELRFGLRPLIRDRLLPSQRGKSRATAGQAILVLCRKDLGLRAGSVAHFSRFRIISSVNCAVVAVPPTSRVIDFPSR